MKFSKKNLRNGDFEKRCFFESAISKKFFEKNKQFCLIPMKTRQRLLVSKDGLKF